MRNFVLLAVLVSLIWNQNFASTVIEGIALDYAGKTLDFQMYSNQISYTEKKLASTKVDNNGHFSVSLTITEPQLVFVHSGVYLLYMFAEPNTHYKVQLPPWLDKKTDEMLNPYFEEKHVHLIVRDCIKEGNVVPLQEELNFYIRSFDDYYGPYMAKYALNVATQREIADRDSSIIKIEALFPDKNHNFYNNYKNYKIGFLQFMSLQNKSRGISNRYFLDKPIQYNNPAYTELFNQVYDKYLVYFGRTPNGRAIYDDVNLNKSYSKLKKTLSQDNVLQNDSLKEFVILKGVHDGFYATDFSRGALLNILDSLVVNTKIPVHKEIGLQIREKVTRLLTGYNPPAFKLYDQQGKLRSIDDFKGKYTYIMFCTTQNYACITEFEQIKKLYQKHSDKLNIITILADENFSESQKFIKGKQLQWTFLHFGNQPEVLKDYDIRAIPTYYLLNREGKLAISPAPSPAENFELILFNEMRSKGLL
jgi:peroxiredoxin